MNYEPNKPGNCKGREEMKRRSNSKSKYDRCRQARNGVSKNDGGEDMKAERNYNPFVSF